MHKDEASGRYIHTLYWHQEAARSDARCVAQQTAHEAPVTGRLHAQQRTGTVGLGAQPAAAAVPAPAQQAGCGAAIVGAAPAVPQASGNGAARQIAPAAAAWGGAGGGQSVPWQPAAGPAQAADGWAAGAATAAIAAPAAAAAEPAAPAAIKQEAAATTATGVLPPRSPAAKRAAAADPEVIDLTSDTD